MASENQKHFYFSQNNFFKQSWSYYEGEGQIFLGDVFLGGYDVFWEGQVRPLHLLHTKAITDYIAFILPKLKVVNK